MTQPSPPHEPQQSPYDLGQVMPQRPAGKRGRLPLIIGGVVALLAVVGGSVGVTLAATSEDDTPRAAATRKPSAWDLEQQAAEPGLDEGEIGVGATTEPTPGPALSASDITLTPKVTEKQCFGSAGCSVSIKVQMAYAGPALSEYDTFEVTYEVKGDEDGPIIGTFEVTGDTYTEQEEHLSTRSKSTKISIKVTDVEKAGL